MISRLSQSQRRRQRVRRQLTVSAQRPRLSVVISNSHVTAQLIDDIKQQTVAYSSSVGQKLPANLSERAQWVGTDIAKKAQAAKIKQVVLDRGQRLYHGRIKGLAEAARKAGLEL